MKVGRSNPIKLKAKVGLKKDRFAKNQIEFLMKTLSADNNKTYLSFFVSKRMPFD
jgi:hypothetical protein